MNCINECVLELYFLFFDVVLGTFGPSLYESAGHLNIFLLLRCSARDLRPLALSYVMTVNLNYSS